jgi:malonate transporter and related proteins
VYVVVFVATYYASKNLGKDNAGRSAVLALTIGFPNAAAIGLPLLTAVYGPHASVSVAVAIAIGAITVTPMTLAILENGAGSDKTSAGETSIGASLWRALKKPVFWAPLLGVLAAAASFHMPLYLDRSLTIVGGATEGTALFVTGLIASAQRFRMDWGVIWSVIGKNVIQPALCLGVALLLSTPLEEAKHAVLLSAVPGGFFGVLFGEGFGVESERASSSLIASTLFCIFTLTGWIIVLDRMH